jgi:thiol-disulfide isomerase/thioredoxin
MESCLFRPAAKILKQLFRLRYVSLIKIVMMKSLLACLLLFKGLTMVAQDSCYARPILDVLAVTRNADSVTLLLKEYAQSFTGCKAPNLDCTTLAGDHFTTEKLTGKVTVLNFWFTHCKPCVGEFASLNKLVDEYAKKGVQFISFAMDKQPVLDTFLVKHPFKYGVVPAATSIMSDFKICSYPTSVVLDKDWHVVQAITGGESEDTQMKNYKRLKEFIDKALGKL